MTDAKQRVQETFSKNAEKYVTSNTHAKGKDLALMVEWSEPNSDWISLDIATGGGHVAKTFSPHVNKVVASDLTKEMLENTASHLGEYKNISYEVADAEQLPFSDQSFDLITCRIASHHFPNPKSFIREVSRVLKQDGKFIMIDNVAPEETELADFMNTLENMRDTSHVRCLPVSEWQKLCKKYHLHVLKSRTRKKTFDFHDWVNRTVEDESTKQKVSSYLRDADPTMKDYFQIKETPEDIEAFSIDEWMVLCEKLPTT
ncbi:class I SAM-dependent methyltransferase [Pontibacillus marinus]|uniref:Methylase n=1 Tax=Pontibacillus marinus BH030004 = DSM 16465 TaxID=1385511 RepID=A0A0A5GE75_9BACI|nr:class I SAM-dependent methyltransferase [Pontibacillus marinus]KGX91491.1 methylase [Pontibacillus marinus BH030004 = DSM 16465]